MYSNTQAQIQGKIVPILKLSMLNKKFSHQTGTVVAIDSISVMVNTNEKCDIIVTYHDIRKLRRDENDVERPEECWSCTLNQFLSKIDDDKLSFEPINDAELREQMLTKTFPWITDEIIKLINI